MWNKPVLCVFLLCLPIFGLSQQCILTLRGTVKDLGTDLPLELVTVLVQESERGTLTDSNGYFQIDQLCAGDYHLIFSHIGCESQQVFVRLERDTTLDQWMEHSENMLSSVVVTGSAIDQTTQSTESLKEQNIADNANENLANMLESIAGVSTIRNGNGIAKPVVHGLYGNRLTILNNGVSQSGQQWGNDHSPEIDPLVANKIRVIKGTSSLEYMGSNLGSVILIEPKKIEKEPHLHGRGTYFFESNGLGNGLNVQLHKSLPKIAWGINATLKKSGDKKTSDYFLNNTGNEEANAALLLEKLFKDNWFFDLYASTFNTRLGVLRGAHIGNLSDLEEAFQRKVPFFTDPNISYRIDAPKQEVNHHLIKIHSKYFMDESQWLDFTLASQLNNRKEFDVRRSGRSDLPALSLLQYSVFLEGKYEKKWDNTWHLKSGVQFNITDNTNNPETGILPLIPDYLSYETGIYFLTDKHWNHSFFEVGIRYDHAMQNVAAITKTTPREIVRYHNSFPNFSASGGWTYSWNKAISFSYNLGYAMRNPAVNELYSGGLHQGVSGIEEGNTALQTEKALKTTLGIKGHVKEKLSIESLLYYQLINDYIYLQPQDEIRLTIRGAFPVFQYQQTNAAIYGLDFNSTYQINRSISARLAYSFIKGEDRSQQLPLVNIPSNNISGSVAYEFSNPIKIGKKQLENLNIEVDSRYVFMQNNLLAEQDFILPPEAYYLLGIKLVSDLQLKKSRLRFTAKVDNVLNTTYRDYLNRQRYFADDLGINAILGIAIKF